MRQPLGNFDDHHEDYELVGEERGAEDMPRPERRLPKILLTLFAMAVFAGGLWFAYVQGTRHPAVTAQSDGVPLIRADDRPTKVKPEQPGGMPVPDQNVSIYSEKPGAQPVEKLLPAPEQPLPRPQPAKEAPTEATPTPPASAGQLDSAPPASTAKPAAPAPAAQANAAAKPAKPSAPPKSAATPASATTAVPAPAAKGPVRLQLASLRTPEAAREEWARLKREYPELLGKLTAVAVRADLGDKGTFYRIQAGPFGDAAAADRLCGELKRRKLGCSLAR